MNTQQLKTMRKNCFPNFLNGKFEALSINAYRKICSASNMPDCFWNEDERKKQKIKNLVIYQYLFREKKRKPTRVSKERSQKMGTKLNPHKNKRIYPNFLRFCLPLIIVLFNFLTNLQLFFLERNWTKYFNSS